MPFSGKAPKNSAAQKMKGGDRPIDCFCLVNMFELKKYLIDSIH
jgi:hypothetical protein